MRGSYPGGEKKTEFQAEGVSSILNDSDVSENIEN